MNIPFNTALSVGSSRGIGRGIAVKLPRGSTTEEAGFLTGPPITVDGGSSVMNSDFMPVTETRRGCARRYADTVTFSHRLSWRSDG